MKTTLLLIVSFIFLVMTACNSEKKESKIQTKDALENIMGRKSVRKYLPKPVEKEKVEVLLKAGMAAPSGKDVRPWELIVIDDREVLDSMAAVLPYAKMLKEAGCGSDRIRSCLDRYISLCRSHGSREKIYGNSGTN